MRIVISSGHGKHIRGASGILDEVNEARKVVESVAKLLKNGGVGVVTFHDDVSTSQNENLNRIVNYHNAQTRDLDVSVHFNAYQTTSKPMGHECLYVTQQSLAAKESADVTSASGLINRGAKKRTDLFFLNSTHKPSILIEVCFVDSQADADTYRSKYDSICAAIASSISGKDVQPEPSPPPEIGERPTLSRGSFGPDVIYLQEQLNEDSDADLEEDGDFGPATEDAVINYQYSRGLDADGIVGPNTWEALETDIPAKSIMLPPKLTDVESANIIQIAMNSQIADYNWNDRGVAPASYIQGFALTFANVYRKFIMGHLPAMHMAGARVSGNSKDVFNAYKEFFDDLGMNNDRAGADTLRHLYALLLGLGMRESSGRHCEGRDVSAENTSSDTAEAGLYQTSYNAHTSAPEFDQTMAEYHAGATADNPQGFLSVFSQNITCSSSSWSCYGSGNGYKFQEMCKKQPAFAVETCAITLRNLCNHYGPINRMEAELRPEADQMLKAVQDYIDNVPMV